MTHHLDGIAERIFQAALAEHRCGELLETFFEGGSATIDDATGALVIFTVEDIGWAITNGGSVSLPESPAPALPESENQ